MILARAERDDAAGLSSASAKAVRDRGLTKEECEAMFDGGYAFLYVTDGGRTVGMCACRAEGTMFQIAAVHIDAELRDGLWRSAVEEMMAYGRSRGDRIAYTNVDVSDSETLARYAGMGFRETSRRQRDAGGLPVTEAELTRVI